ncbi:GatB/YqeY domain-containing protein [Patescibacteria group bacterium]|nr:GatB/YqeY domain-containing protein [Patescibacteria group bacterium]
MLKEEIQNEITQAMKDGNNLVCSTLRMLSASIVFKEKEKRFKISKLKPDLSEEGLIRESQLQDEDIIEVVSSEIKKRKDSVTAYEEGNRQELVDKEKKEIEILQKYLPKQISEDEVRKIVTEAVAKIGAKEIKDMGRVMKDLNLKIKGRADNSLVSKIVKELLEKK